MNILMATEYYFGNPDLVKLSAELAREGHQIDVLTSYSPSFYKFDEPEGVLGINLVEANPHIDILSLPYTVTFPFAQIAKIIRQHGIELCHTIMARATNSFAVAFMSERLNVKHVHTVQGIGTATGRLPVDLIAGFYDRTFVRYILKSAEKVIVLSKSIAEYATMHGANPERIVVVPSGVDCSVFDPNKPEVKKSAEEIRDKLQISGDAIVVGYVGRIVPVKGLKYLILGMSEVQRKHPDVNLLIVGDGYEKSELETLAKKLNVNVHFVGWAKNVTPFYAAMDVFSIPSLLEGLSNSLLEAMAMGKPLVATKVGGNKDVIMDGKNGFLVPTQDSKSIMLSINRLIESDPLRESIGKSNRQTALKHFTWERTVSKIERVYKSVIQARSTYFGGS